MIRSTTRALLVVYLACVAGTMVSAAPRFQIQTPSQAAPAVVYAAADDVPEPVRLETFRIVWETVRDRYFDPTFGGIDWPAIRERYRPLVLAAPKSEVFAGAIQESGRAIVLGRTSYGGVLNSTTEQLPTGGTLQYPHSDMRTPKGRRIEGAGVVPDVAVELRQADLLVGKDTVVEKAIEVLTQAAKR